MRRRSKSNGGRGGRERGVASWLKRQGIRMRVVVCVFLFPLNDPESRNRIAILSSSELHDHEETRGKKHMENSTRHNEPYE